jgi:hypothetical protein
MHHAPARINVDAGVIPFVFTERLVCDFSTIIKDEALYLCNAMHHPCKREQRELHLYRR